MVERERASTRAKTMYRKLLEKVRVNTGCHCSWCWQYEKAWWDLETWSSSNRLMSSNDCIQCRIWWLAKCIYISTMKICKGLVSHFKEDTCWSFLGLSFGFCLIINHGNWNKWTCSTYLAWCNEHHAILWRARIFTGHINYWIWDHFKELETKA